MSNFTCEHCDATIIDSPFGYISGCRHYPVGNIWRICRYCDHNWDGHCIKGNDTARSNPESIIHTIGCEVFTPCQKAIKKRGE